MSHTLLRVIASFSTLLLKAEFGVGKVGGLTLLLKPLRSETCITFSKEALCVNWANSSILAASPFHPWQGVRSLSSTPGSWFQGFLRLNRRSRFFLFRRCHFSTYFSSKAPLQYSTSGGLTAESWSLQPRVKLPAPLEGSFSLKTGTILDSGFFFPRLKRPNNLATTNARKAYLDFQGGLGLRRVTSRGFAARLRRFFVDPVLSSIETGSDYFGHAHRGGGLGLRRRLKQKVKPRLYFWGRRRLFRGFRRSRSVLVYSGQLKRRVSFLRAYAQPSFTRRRNLLQKDGGKFHTALFKGGLPGAAMLLQNSHDRRGVSWQKPLTWLSPKKEGVRRILTFLQQTRLDFDFRMLSGRFRQPQVRYKPGFTKYWRYHRLLFRKEYGLVQGFRQHRLTRFLTRFRRVASFSTFRIFQLSPLCLLQQSQLFLGEMGPCFSNLLKSNAYTFIFLNGVRLTNLHAQLYMGDMLFISGRCTSFDLRNRAGLGPGYFHDLYSRIKVQVYADDSPSYLEVDELSQSVTILFEPVCWSLYLKRTSLQFPFSTVRLYNWKYIT